jgi:hypothetical protein
VSIRSGRADSPQPQGDDGNQRSSSPEPRGERGIRTKRPERPAAAKPATTAATIAKSVSGNSAKRLSPRPVASDPQEKTPKPRESSPTAKVQRARTVAKRKAPDVDTSTSTDSTASTTTEQHTEPARHRRLVRPSPAQQHTATRSDNADSDADDLADFEADVRSDAEKSGMHTMDGKPAAPVLPARPVSRNLDPSQLYRGRTRMALLRDLAMGEWTHSSIANSVGVPTEIIDDFAETYEVEITEVRTALAGQLAIESAGLWISKKYNRLGELQSDFEDIDVVIDVMRKNTKVKIEQNALSSGSDSMVKGDTFDTDLLLGSRRHQNLLRSKIAILKAVADELAPRNNKDKEEKDETAQIRYVIEQDPGTPGDDIIGALT